MCNYLVFGVVAILVTSCQPRPSSDDVTNNYIEQPLDKKVKYHYQYGIEDAASGVLSHKWEERLGNYVKGAYSLMEPDGRIRTVDYEVDGPKGFKAVIRTSLPGNSFLSFQQLRKSRLTHSDPPVNILTNNPVTKPVLDRQPRLIHKDLPPNFHSVKPDYFWGSLPHDHFSKHARQFKNHDKNPTSNHNEHHHLGNEPTTNHGDGSQSPPVRVGKSLHQFNSAAPTSEFNVAVENRRKNDGVARGRVENRGGQLSEMMLPPSRDAKIMNYDHLLRAGMITDALFIG